LLESYSLLLFHQDNIFCVTTQRDFVCRWGLTTCLVYIPVVGFHSTVSIELHKLTITHKSADCKHSNIESSYPCESSKDKSITG